MIFDSLTLVIPMAGHGSRFSRAGYQTPKPLIEIDGMPMFVRAARSLPLDLATALVFVVLKEHVNEYSIDTVIRSAFPDYPLHVVIIDEVTRGQAETVSVALQRIGADGPVVIFNADSAFESDLGSILKGLPQDVSGALQYFVDEDPRWSFMVFDSDFTVVETAEKRVISRYASTGLYFFSSAKDFLEAAKNLDPENGELYIAPIYNKMLKIGRRVVAIPAGRYYCFGTPEDLEAYRSGKFFTSE